jgi:hypothetical protein
VLPALSSNGRTHDPFSLRSVDAGEGFDISTDPTLAPMRAGHQSVHKDTTKRNSKFKINKALNVMNSSKYHTRRRSLAVSQSLNVVAPFLRDAMHPEFQKFLSQRLKLPTIINDSEITC